MKRKSNNSSSDIFIWVLAFAVIVVVVKKAWDYMRVYPAVAGALIAGVVIILAIIIANYKEKQREHRRQQESFLFYDQIDQLDGQDFEQWCALFLSYSGFDGITVTKASGDHGIDIIAKKDNRNYAIQCKRYSGNVGNKAIQEAYSGCAFYRADIPVVMTNSYFTNAAKQEAANLGVVLWDRSTIAKQLSELRKKQSTDI